MSSGNGQNIVLGIFRLFEIVDFQDLLVWVLLNMMRILKGLITFGDFWVGMSKNTEEKGFLWLGGGVAFT